MLRIYVIIILFFIFRHGFSQLKSYLPVITIDTNGQSIPNEPKINVRIKVIYKGPGILNNETDSGNQYEGTAGIEIRGESSQMFPKKSYSVELRNSNGSDLEVGLIGMPPESDWVLYAPYSDKSLLRNALSYYLARRMGNWQPGFRFVEVVLNGQYIGIYQLIEKIKRDKNRLDIPKLENTDLTGDNLTGGYIFKVDKLTGLTSADYFTSNPSNRFQNARNYTYIYEYPRGEDLVSVQKEYLKSTILVFENILNSSTFNNPAFGYSQYIDVESFIDYHIIYELANNVDGYRYSTFFYKQRNSNGGKIFAGPVWDFDISYGNLNYSYRNQSTTEWNYLNYGSSADKCMHWWARFMQDPTYVGKLKARWSNLRTTIFQTDSIMNWIDNQSVTLGDAVTRNFTRWPILGTWVWPNSFIGKTYAEEVNQFKNWIRNRLTWMDSQWMLKTNTSVDEFAMKFIVFPNPASTWLNIKNGGKVDNECQIELINNTGQRVYQNHFTGKTNFTIDVGILNSGVYLLRITTKNNFQYSQKVLIQRYNQN